MRSAEGIARPVKKCDCVGSECGESGECVKFQEYKKSERRGYGKRHYVTQKPPAAAIAKGFLKECVRFTLQF
jgi:hypothetical protein